MNKLLYVCALFCLSYNNLHAMQRNDFVRTRNYYAGRIQQQNNNQGNAMNQPLLPTAPNVQNQNATGTKKLTPEDKYLLRGIDGNIEPDCGGCCNIQ